MIEFQIDKSVCVDSFAVIGERCSGTNLIKHLVTSCFDLEQSDSFGWKHGFPCYPAYHPKTLYIMVARQPLDWIKSLYQRPHQTGDRYHGTHFSDFIRMEWASCLEGVVFAGDVNRFERRDKFLELMGRELQFDVHPIDGRRFKNPIELRNFKLRGHYSMKRRAPNFCYVTLDQLLADPQGFAEMLCLNYGFNLPNDYRPPDRRLGHFAPTPKWRKKQVQNISPNDIEFICSNLDESLETQMGFAMPKVHELEV